MEMRLWQLRRSGQADALRTVLESIGVQNDKLRIENEALKTDKRSLELALASAAGGSAQPEDADFVFGITPHDLRTRWLAGWKVEHYHVSDGKVDVVLRRQGKAARKERTRSGNTGHHIPPVTRPIAPPANPPRPAAVSPALTGDAFIIPGEVHGPRKSGFLGDTPTDPHWRNKQPKPIHDAGRAPRTPPPSAPSPMSSVMSAFTRNLQRNLEQNPVPQYSDRPTA